MFWSLYQMAPNGLQLFAVNNVDLHAFGHAVAPQWVQNINAVVIAVGGPLLAAAFVGCASVAGASTCRSSSRRRCS